MHSLEPILVQLPFLGIHPSVNEYASFCFEPMLNLSFGVIWLLMECLWSIWSKKNRQTVTLRTGSSKCKTFKAASTTVHSTINWLFTYSQNWFMGSGIWVVVTTTGAVASAQRTSYRIRFSKYAWGVWLRCCGDCVSIYWSHCWWMLQSKKKLQTLQKALLRTLICWAYCTKNTWFQDALREHPIFFWTNLVFWKQTHARHLARTSHNR